MPVPGYSPPPFFNRGLTPQAKLALYLVISVALLVGDLKFSYLETVRQGATILAYPFWMAAGTPVQMITNTRDYFASLRSLQKDNATLRQSQLDASAKLLRYRELEQENHSLRELLEMHKRLEVHTTAADIISANHDPFTRRVVINQGKLAGVEDGLLVADATGVVGQVTQVFPLHAEVTLLTDKNQAIPVQLSRSGLRAVLFGLGNGLMELRYLATNADIQVGDRIATSGLDGKFVPGLPVAVVMRIDRENSAAFARILCRPLGGVENSTQVLVIGRVPTPAPVIPPRVREAMP